MDTKIKENEDRCAICGEPIPEGRQVCPGCEEKSGASMDERGREVDIFDILPAEAIADANRLGFEFLSERGYDAIGAWEDAEKLSALERELSERGEELRYSGAYDQDDQTGRLKAILIWYTLHDREGRLIARSKGLKLVPTETQEKQE